MRSGKDDRVAMIIPTGGLKGTFFLEPIRRKVEMGKKSIIVPRSLDNDFPSPAHHVSSACHPTHLNAWVPPHDRLPPHKDELFFLPTDYYVAATSDVHN